MNGDWYQAAGFLIFGWFFVSVAAGLVIKHKSGKWYTWLCCLIGALCTTAGGTYIAKLGFVEWVVDFAADHPLLAFILFIGALVLLLQSTARAVPDDYHPMAFTVGVVMLLTLLPSGIKFIPGDLGDQVNHVGNQYAAMVNGEAGTWFKPHGNQPGAK